MKNLLILLAATSLFSTNSIAQTTSRDILTDKVVEIFTPFAIDAGLVGIKIEKDFENPDYSGGMDVIDKYIKITMGSEYSKRYPGLTDDGYAYVLCHELGHFFAGPPYKSQNNELSSEGQSDYWAGAVCLKKLFRAMPELIPAVLKDPFVEKNCGHQFQTLDEINICSRIAMAGMNFMTELHLSIYNSNTGFKIPFYRKPDFSQKETAFFSDYPSLQCRTETIAAGGFCNTSENSWVNKNKDWACSPPSVGARPACWFKN